MSIVIKRDKRFRPTGAQLREANRLLREELGKQAVELAKGTTATWDTQVNFEAVNTTRSVEVATDSDVWQFVNKGTRPHEIRPKRPGGRLFFQAGYNAKTRPGSLSSSAGGPFGQTVAAQVVQHPGTKARRFDKLIAAQLGPLVVPLWREFFKKVRGR